MGSTCMTEAQFAAVLSATNQTPAPPSGTKIRTASDKRGIHAQRYRKLDSVNILAAYL